MRVLPLLLLLCACDGAADTDTDAACIEVEDLSWQAYGRPFLADWCLSCHAEDNPNAETYGVPEGVYFETWDEVQVWKGPIAATLLDESMPLGGGMDEDDRALAVLWFQCLD